MAAVGPGLSLPRGRPKIGIGCLRAMASVKTAQNPFPMFPRWLPLVAALTCLLLPASGEVRTCVCGVRLTIAVLARCRGTVFLRDAEPLAPAWLDGPMLDLWEPAPLAGWEGPCASR